MLLKLSDFRSSDERPFLSYAIVGGTILMSVAGIGSSPEFMNGLPTLPGIMTTFLILSSLSWMIWMVSMANRQSMEKVARYKGYLAQQSVDLIAASFGSPEYDDESKSVMLQHLNSNHQGWSFRTT